MDPSSGARKSGVATFADCAIAFVPSAALPASAIAAISVTLVENGAAIVEPARDGSIQLAKVTHIVANSIDFSEHAAAQAAMIPVVTSGWALHSAAKGRQMPLRSFSPDPRLIFSKVLLTCADLPVVDKETIGGAVTALGGVESPDLTKLTTHICALSMDHPKCQRARAQALKAKIVLPHWFDDCFKLGRRIDEGPYLLPDPEILRRDDDPAARPVLVPPNADAIRGASTATPDHPPMPARGPSGEESARPPLTVFAHKMVKLADDLTLTPQHRGIIVDLIVHGGGRMVDDVDDCDMLVCPHRDGDDYVRASRQSKDVGNLAWLYHLITNNEWISPFRRLLHYPVARAGVPGFEKLVISISNYGGDARTYLENLIRATGATYTRTMTADNSHLITARNSGDKCAAAADWNISTVNHLWLEECYAQHRLLVPTPKHMHFPNRTNLGEVVGQTSFDRELLRDLFFPGKKGGSRSKQKRDRHESAKGRSPPLKEETVEEVAVEQTEEAEAQDGEEEEDRTEAHNGNGNGDDADVNDGKDANDEKDANSVKNANDENDANNTITNNTGANDTKKNSKKATSAPKAPKTQKAQKAQQPPAIDVATPARPRAGPTEIEASTVGRSAKAKALVTLHNIAPDIALYEREKKRGSKDGGPWGGKRAADLMDAMRSSSPADDDDADGRPAKKMRPSLPPVEKRVVLTGFERWAQQPAAEAKERKKLRDMGILIVQPNQPCDYLVAPHIVRTVKFLVALARGPMVLSCKYIDKALEMGAPPPPEDFILEDTEGEERCGLKLETTLARARANRGHLLRSVPIYCTAGIRNGFESYKNVAEAHGALFKIYRGRSSTIRPTTAEQDGGRAPEPVYLLSSNTPEERALWPRFEEMAVAGHMEPRIVAPDWLLEAVLRQQVWFEDKFLVARFFRSPSEASEEAAAAEGGQGRDGWVGRRRGG